MTYEEAIKTIEIAKAEVEWNYPLDYQIAFDKVIEALEKQIPKKPIWEDGHCYCPHKHKSAIKGVGYWTIGTGQEYCDLCGQKLKWGDEQ